MNNEETINATINRFYTLQNKLNSGGFSAHKCLPLAEQLGLK